MFDVTLLQQQLLHKSLREICRDNNWSYGKCYRFCKKHNINVSRDNNGKSNTTIKSRAKSRKIPDNVEILTELYITQNKSLAEIAKIYNTTSATVMYALKRNGIPTKFKNGKFTKIQPFYSKDLLVMLYTTQKKSLEEICQLLDEYKYPVEVQRDLKFYNINRRSYKEAGKELYIKRPEKKDLHRDQLYAGITGPKQDKITSLEQKFIDWAEENNIDIIYQFQIRKNWHRYDFKIQNTNIIIEMDGTFWHSLPEHIERDNKFVDTANRFGYNVIRITDVEIKENPNIFNEKITPLL